MKKFQKDVEMIHKVELLKKGDTFFIPIDKNKQERDSFLQITTHVPKKIRENLAYEKYPVDSETFVVEKRRKEFLYLKGEKSGNLLILSKEQLKKLLASYIKEKWNF